MPSLGIVILTLFFSVNCFSLFPVSVLTKIFQYFYFIHYAPDGHLIVTQIVFENIEIDQVGYGVFYQGSAAT